MFAIHSQAGLATHHREVTGLGIGKDVWTIPFDNLTEALKVNASPSQTLHLADHLVSQFYYIDEILYLVALPTIKIAICCTYLRIFQTKGFRQLVFVAIGLNVAYAITFVLITVFQCSPVELVCVLFQLQASGDADMGILGVASLGQGASGNMQQYQRSVVGIGWTQYRS